MRKGCAFCQMVQGKIKIHKVYEDDYTMAFTDNHPVNPGHLLVLPKEHAPRFYDLDDTNYMQLMKVVKKLAKKVNEVFDPKKVGIIIAGWDVPHTHIHIVPMHNYHDIPMKSFLESKRTNPTDEELKQVAEELIREIMEEL